MKGIIYENITELNHCLFRHARFLCELRGGRPWIRCTGHLLGGFLAQIVSYEITEEKIDNSAFWWFNENKLQKILDNNPDMFKRGMTYNAAPFSINAMFYSILTNAIPPLTLVSKDYDALIFNYSIKNDILSEAVWLGAAARIGRDIPVLDYDGDLSDSFVPINYLISTIISNKLWRACPSLLFSIPEGGDTSESVCTIFIIKCALAFLAFSLVHRDGNGFRWGWGICHFRGNNSDRFFSQPFGSIP